MKDYIAMFQQKIAEIEQEVKAVHIVNAGNMNHGKSSLFNSLLDCIHFAEEDIRTTVVADKVLWQDNVYLVDTPGLDAEDTDDKEAYKAYPRANVIIFVHTLGTGELHANELAAINKIKTFFVSEDFFWQHFCLVLTAADAQDEENLAKIKGKILLDVKNVCGGENFRTFVVSNPRYRKGRDEDKKVLLNMEEEGDALDILARRYLDMHCAVMSPNPHRYSILKDLARDFAVDAVVDLTWQGCQPYDVESWSVKKFVREELGLPFLQVVTDYSGTDTEQLKVRLEAFLEMLA